MSIVVEPLSSQAQFGFPRTLVKGRYPDELPGAVRRILTMTTELRRRQRKSVTVALADNGQIVACYSGTKEDDLLAHRLGNSHIVGVYTESATIEDLCEAIEFVAADLALTPSELGTPA